MLKNTPERFVKILWPVWYLYGIRPMIEIGKCETYPFKRKEAFNYA